MKKILAIILAAVMVFSLAACGGAAESAAPAAEVKADEAQPAATNGDEAPAAEAASGDVTEIYFLTWRSEDSDTFKEIIAEFEKQNPDIKVNLEITSTDESEYDTILKSRLLSGEGADVMNVGLGARMKTLARAGYLLALDDTDVADDIEEAFIDAGRVDGTLYGLGMTYNGFGMYYNADLFEELGIKVPENYEELLEACKKSRDAGYQPIAAGFGDVWTSAFAYCPMLANEVKGDKDVEKYLETGEKTLKDEPYQTVFHELAQMRDDGIFQDNASGTGYDAQLSLFASGKATMMVDGTWSVGSVSDMNPDINIGLCHFPSMKTDSYSLLDGPMMLAINSGSKNLEAAKKFAHFLVGPVGNKMYCEGTQQPSTVKGVVLESENLNKIKDFIGDSAMQYVNVELDHGEVSDILDSTAAAILNGADVDEELEKAQMDIDSAVGR